VGGGATTANSPPAGAATGAGSSVRHTRSARHSPAPDSTDIHSRRAGVDVVSTATGAASSEMPRARGALKNAAGTDPLTWLV
jgi:hypothetical protein